MNNKEAMEILKNIRSEHLASIVTCRANEKEEFFKIHFAYNKAIEALETLVIIKERIQDIEV